MKKFLTEKLELLQQLDKQILELSLELDENEIHNEVSKASDEVVAINTAILKIDECIGHSSNGNDNASVPSTYVSVSRSASRARSDVGSEVSFHGRGGKVRLPKLELPKFNGDVR